MSWDYEYDLKRLWNSYDFLKNYMSKKEKKVILDGLNYLSSIKIPDQEQINLIRNIVDYMLNLAKLLNEIKSLPSPPE